MRTSFRSPRAGLAAFILPGLLGCSSGANSPVGVPAVNAELPASARVLARDIRAADSLLLVHATRDVREIAQAALPRDASGLIGRNREWGAMYAARFQLGTGGALRIALTLPSSADSERDARAALIGVEVGLQDMHASGQLAANVPPSIAMGRSPAPIDIASGAAFYLGDACLGLLALDAAPARDAIASNERRKLTRTRLVQSASWLRTQANLLLNGDKQAPNRLLFDARAFLACGVLAGDSTLLATGMGFVAEFRRSVTPEGWFLEGTGWDTSYQAVSLDIGMDVVLLLPSGPVRTGLRDELRRGGIWLQSRVHPDGRVNSRGNARTCGGGESFLGTPKGLAVKSVVSGLVRVAVLGGPSVDSIMLDASRRVSGWARENGSSNGCFEDF